MRVNARDRCRLCRALASGWTVAGGKGGGGTVSATIPSEMKPLISNSVSGTISMQPAAMDWFQGFIDSSRTPEGREAQRLQIAPMTGVEQGLYSGANAALGGLTGSELGYVDANKALNLQGPLNQLARTTVATPQAEVDLRNQGMQGLQLLDSNRNAGPVQAQGEYYENLLGSLGLLGQRAGATSQEQGATSALQSLTGVAGQPITTPQAEQQALEQIFSLTSGSLGSSPATREAIAAMERGYETRALPAMQNQLAQAGLGRSGALEQGITDLRGKLFEAEVPLFQQEIANRKETLPILQDIAQAQQGRQTGSMDRIIQALNAQATGLTSLGGQLGGRTQTDLQRDAATRLGLGSQLGTQQQTEQVARDNPINQELGYLESTFNPLLNLSAQQQARSQIPIERQLSTAFQAAPAFQAQNQSQIDLAKMIGEVGSLPRQQQQAINDAALATNMREQALAEALVLGPLDVLPSLLGSKTSSSGGGMFGS